MESSDSNIHLGKDTTLKPDSDFEFTVYSSDEAKLLKPLKLIPITEHLPEENQDVIGWNGKKLVAAKYVTKDVLIDEKTYATESKGIFQVEKYSCELDRTVTTYWNEITHWMPAFL
jgi:hypothetical protein